MSVIKSKVCSQWEIMKSDKLSDVCRTQDLSTGRSAEVGQRPHPAPDGAQGSWGTERQAWSEQSQLDLAGAPGLTAWNVSC